MLPKRIANWIAKDFFGLGDFRPLLPPHMLAETFTGSNRVNISRPRRRRFRIRQRAAEEASKPFHAEGRHIPCAHVSSPST